MTKIKIIEEVLNNYKIRCLIKIAKGCLKSF